MHSIVHGAGPGIGTGSISGVSVTENWYVTGVFVATDEVIVKLIGYVPARIVPSGIIVIVIVAGATVWSSVAVTHWGGVHVSQRAPMTGVTARPFSVPPPPLVT